MDGTLFEHTDANFFPPFNLSPLHASITFPAPSPAPIPVCSDLVSSRHGKHQTSFFTVLRCITIDRSQLGRYSIRNNSDNVAIDRSFRRKGRIVSFSPLPSFFPSNPLSKIIYLSRNSIRRAKIKITSFLVQQLDASFNRIVLSNATANRAAKKYLQSILSRYKSERNRLAAL